MESSEDDAGNATIASCRASARETDVRQTEEVAAPRDNQPEPPDARTACRTPAMSDDNYDGDSVPSPAGSAQDVNTSTEAILDMIDEFVDGPGAAKRLPRMLDFDKRPDVNKSVEPCETEPILSNKVEQPSIPPTHSDNSALHDESIPQSLEVTPHSETAYCAGSSSIRLPHTVSVSVDIKDNFTNQPTDYNRSLIHSHPESVPEQPVLQTPSSSVPAVQNTLDVKQTERTVKHVTSSDNRDSVTVEKAESTSSECSVSEIKELSKEPLNRSPLKRKLVRLVVSDRRPDSTVSSTVDSQSNILTAQLSKFDVVMKDVSSSSDALPLQSGDEKPEAISNVSEISVCKAETSRAPKKIRLVRPKVTHDLSNSVNTPEATTPGKEPCQSTSPDEQASTKIFAETTTSSVNISKIQDHDRSELSMSIPTKNVSEDITLPCKSESSYSNKAHENVTSIENTHLTDLETTSLVQVAEQNTVKNTLVLESNSSQLETLKQTDVELTTIQSKSLNLVDVPKAPSLVQLKELDTIETALVLESTTTQSRNQKQTDNPDAPRLDQPIKLDTINTTLLLESITTQSEGLRVADAQKAASLDQLKELETTTLVSESVTIKSESIIKQTDTSKDSYMNESIEIKTTCQPETSEPSHNNSKSTKPSEIQHKVESVQDEDSNKNVNKIFELKHQEIAKIKPNVEQDSGSNRELKSIENQPADVEPAKNEDALQKLVPCELVQPNVQAEIPVSEENVLIELKSRKSLASAVQIDLTPANETGAKECQSVSTSADKHSNQEQEQEQQQLKSELEVPIARAKESQIEVPIAATNESQSLSSLAVDNSNLEKEVVQHKIEPEVPIECQTLSKQSETKMLADIESKSIELITNRCQPKILKESHLKQVSGTISKMPEQSISEIQKVDVTDIEKPAVSKPTIVQPDHSKYALDEINQLEPKEIVKLDTGITDPYESVSNTLQIITSEEPLQITGSEASEKSPLLSKYNTLDSDKKLPPIKLTLTRVVKAEKTPNDIGVQSVSSIINTIDNFHQHKQDLISDAALNCDSSAETDMSHDYDVSADQKKVPPIKLNLSCDYNTSLLSSPQKSNTIEDKHDSTKQVPKLTIKLGNKQVEDTSKSPIPKLTIKPIKPPTDQSTETGFGNQHIPNVTKLNIKPIFKPQEDNLADKDFNDEFSKTKQKPSVTKLNIKAIPKPADKINVKHRKSSSSEISESEYSENDETSTSDPSVSDQGPSDTVPKVTIKLGKPGTESEGKFYTEKNIPKLTIKGLHHSENDEKDSKLKLVISQAEDLTMEKIPKLTIKTIAKSENQPLSPKLTIKPIKPPENDSEIPKLLITTDACGSSSEIKDKMPVPKLTIRAVTKTDSDITKTPKKSTVSDIPDHIPSVTKLNIKPILKPLESEGSSGDLVDKVPVVSKLNIKPIVKPKDNEEDSIEDVPKIMKLNIKPLKSPVENSSEEKDCDENLADIEDRSIPVITKLNIKPIVKPKVDEVLKDSENQSSETSTSSDDNSDHIPVVTKLNIKPVVKPTEQDDTVKPIYGEQSLPTVTKLNIKPLVKPEENSPSSPKREAMKSPGGSGLPTVTKLNIKPIIKPEDNVENKAKDEHADKSSKNRPLVMKINMKNVCDSISDQKYNNFLDGTKSPRLPMSPKTKKTGLTQDQSEPQNIVNCNIGSPSLLTVSHASMAVNRNCLPLKDESAYLNENKSLTAEILNRDSESTNAIQINVVHDRNTDLVNVSPISPGSVKQKKSLQNCTLLKQLLSYTKDDSEKNQEMGFINCVPHFEKPDKHIANCNVLSKTKSVVEENKKQSLDSSTDQGGRSPISDIAKDLNLTSKSLRTRSIQDIRNEVNDSVTKPLEIVTEKNPIQSSGQDSPRIILKINKTDHGPSSEIITEESYKPIVSSPQDHDENAHEAARDKLSPKKQYINSRKKSASETVSPVIGKRLRSSRVVETPEKSATAIRRNAGKRSSMSETSLTLNKESEISVLDSKRLKLEQILLANKSLSITPVASNFTQTPPSKAQTDTKPAEKNHSLLNNDNSKNGNSKLHNILTNLQAKQMQSLQMAESNILSKDLTTTPDAESNTSIGSDMVSEISRIENCCPEVQEMMINENTEFRDLSIPDEVSQDPLEMIVTKPVEPVVESASIKAVEVTPTPRKRGRPRKIPLPDGAKPSPKPPSPPTLPVTALEERPQRSLRLLRDKPVVTPRPRGGRGRGRGGRRAPSPIQAPTRASDDESTETVIVIETLDEDEPRRPAITPRPATPEDPTSSRIKLPRMTEALDKSNACMTPLSSRRRSSNDMKLFGEPSVVIESPLKIEEYMKSPETKTGRGRGGRGRGTPRGRTPRGRGRGRGGGKGATYMKETMGIYGRVCGPATTTVELFEEETCMMDDNATPKPSHLLDEDSQSSVKSSTNDSSNKMRKSKFADLFDSNKLWTASDVKEYTWPPYEVPNVEHQVMMIQEQVAMFLGVKSFKRRYSELKRRAVVGEEKDYCLRQGIVTEALCDLGITAVDASDVLDIMLSDYPHKYEEYRSYQREKQLTDPLEITDVKIEEKAIKVEIKSEKTSDKPEPPKVDPEKTRQDMAAAAIASAAEWNAMLNSCRQPACVDLQSNTIHRRRPAPLAVRTHCRPPHGFYPHAILPGQYQHTYRTYTPDQLRYFPLNTVVAAPAAPPSPAESSSESEGSWGSGSSGDESHPPHSAKRKKLCKSKRSSQQERGEGVAAAAAEEPAELCRACGLRLEANRKYTHERFLVCAHCNAKLHPSCLELNADTIRKCREYPWQCAECKTCGSCQQPARGDKMLFCDLCDRGHHLTCLGLALMPAGRWHCVECAICKSCGARSPEGVPGAGPSMAGVGSSAAGAGPSAPAEWHHQTRRGPGGHKVYSHSLCTPCARAYRIGRYCPLCERSFIGPKGTIQLVICKLCDRQLHQECVKSTVSSLNVLDYTCGECRRGGITSRAGAVRAAPRTIATLFMAKRRFNKYAHRQYMQSRQKDLAPADADPADPPSDPDTCPDPDASDPLDTDSRTDFGD